MKSKKRGAKVLPNPASGQRQSWGYDPVFKRSVILFAEQKGIREGSIRFNLPEITIRRWKRIRNEIMEKAQQNTRRSQRRTGGYCGGSSAETGNSSEDMIVDLSNDIDSMPLEKRLSQNHNELTVPAQETVLQSQSISPTKLKVTRQGRLNVPASQTATPLPPEVCLKWNTQHTNMQSVFPNLLMKEQYVDATLVSEGKTMKCHRIVLSMCSPYFEEILNGIGPFQHPVLFMKDVPFWILKSLCDFMYAGEIRILQDKLDELLNVATLLKIKGLAGIPESAEQVKANSPNIKQETEAFSRVHNKSLKLETEEEEEPPPPTPPRTPTPKFLGRGSRHHDSTRFSKYKVVASDKDETIKSPKPLSFSRRREDKKVKLVDKEKAIEAKVSSGSKRVIKPSAFTPTHASRRKNYKNKIEINVTKVKDVEKEKPPLKKVNINDPLDLLQPVYEEIAKDEAPQMVRNVLSGRLKERGNVPVRKGVGRRVRKRRYMEYKEDADDSSPTPFQSRKGTRSRPNVKVPKFFHTQYEDPPKDSTDATIVREPHTDHDDPLIEEVGEIKVEPVDVEENPLSWIPQDQEEEEIMGNYDSPLVNIAKRNSPNSFNKVLEAQSDIMNPAELNIKQEKLQLVDINQFNKEINEPIINFNSTESPRENKSEIMISNIQSMADVPEEPRLSENGQGKPMEDVQSSEIQGTTMDIAEIEKVIGCVAVKPLEVLTLDPRESGTAVAMIYPTGLPQLEADPLAQIGGQEASHESGTSEDVHIEEAGPDILVLEQDSLDIAAEDNKVQTQSETLEKEIVSKIVVESQDIIEEADFEHVEDVNIGEITPNEDTALQIEETQTLAEEREASEESTSPAVANKIRESLGTEKGAFENLKDSKLAECLTEKMEETCEELTNLTLMGPIEETKKIAVEDSNIEENLAAPSRENLKLINEETSHLDKDNLEPQATTLPSVGTFNSQYIDPDIDDSVSHISEPKNQTDQGQNNIEIIEDSNLDLERRAEEVKVESVDGEQKKVTVENVAVSIQQETENNKSIDELEQCLASTSTTASPKTSGLSSNVQLLPIENFTKDIEFGNITPGNRPANYLGDCESDYDMDDAEFEESKSEERINNEENKTGVLEYENEEELMEFDKLPHNNEIDIAHNLETESVQENLALDIHEVEVDLTMEESLLADLDEDIKMEEATTSQIEEDDDGTEKTLEMIVNDLNESLGEMRQ